MRIRNRAAALLLCFVTAATGLETWRIPAAAAQEETMAAREETTAAGEETAAARKAAAASSGVIYADSRTDFRDESIYFVMTTRFYDGDPENNEQCWDGTQYDDESDPEWRGDFKGLAEKLDYIKALGFTAVWITPVVENSSGYDYHGYHALNFSKVDPRYESDDFTYQDFIDAAHEKGLKVIQDVVFNHTGNFGESNLMPMFEKEGDLSSSDCLQEVENSGLPENYDEMTPDQQYQARLALMKNTDGINHDVNNIYHHEQSLGWEDYTCQTAQIAGDCVDLNTENPTVYNYLQDAYSQYIDMGVDAFRVDTTKHISRLTFNNALIEPFYEAAEQNGNDSFYMFGEVCTRVREVWNKGVAPLSAPFYTWKESKDYAWSDTDTAVNEASAWQNFNDNLSIESQPVSDNAFLDGNDYHEPDYTENSGLGVIDFPMHWNFENANSAFRVAVNGDQWYNDATWNVTYVDSHDYAPDQAPSDQRFSGSQETWAENLSLMFTFRGIPCIYYGSEIEFQKGKPIDVGPNAPLSETGRAYFGDYIEGDVLTTDFGEYFGATGAMEETLNHPLALHLQRLNKVRQAVPALRKGQYSTSDISGSEMAFKRRYTDDTTDSFALVTVSESAVFQNIPNGTYVDCITGDTKHVTNGTLTAECSGRGNLRVYVLNTEKTPAPGKVGEEGRYLYSDQSAEPAEQQCIYFENSEGWKNVTANIFDASGNLKESLAMTQAEGNIYACSYTGSADGAEVVFTDGNEVSRRANFKEGGIYNMDGYTGQYQIGDPVIEVTDVIFDRTEINLDIGSTAEIKAQVLPEDAKNKTLTWSSSDTDVAEVKNGVITPQGAGTAVITAVSGNGIRAQAEVNVTVPPYDYETVPEDCTAVYFNRPKAWGDRVNCYLYYGTNTELAGAWPGSAMEKLPNGVYRYVYETPENGESVKVLFNSGGSQTPASGGFDVTAYGLYGQNGLEQVIEPSIPDPGPTDPDPEPVSELRITGVEVSCESPQKTGTSVKLTVHTEGGEGELRYRFYREKDAYVTVFRQYQRQEYAYCNPAAGTYNIYVDVRDEAGNVETERIVYQWK